MSLVDTFLACSLRILSTPTPPPELAGLAKAIQVLDLSAANLAAALVLLHRYVHNSVNSLDSDGLILLCYGIVAALVLSNKYINDQSYLLKTWHLILSKSSPPLPALLLLMNQLEGNFLAALGYSLLFDTDESLWMWLGDINPTDLRILRSAIERLQPFCDVSPMSMPTVLQPMVLPMMSINSCLSASNTSNPTSMMFSSPPPPAFVYSSHSSTPLTHGPVTPVNMPGPGPMYHVMTPYGQPWDKAGAESAVSVPVAAAAVAASNSGYGFASYGTRAAFGGGSAFAWPVTHIPDGLYGEQFTR